MNNGAAAPSPAPKKKKLSKGAIAGIVIASVLVVVLIVVLSVAGALGIFAGPSAPTIVEAKETHVYMYGANADELLYYVGTKNDVELAKAFPGATAFAGSAVKTGNKLQAGELTFKTKDGKDVKYTVKAVDAFNVLGETMEADMKAKLNDGVSVVMHENLTTKGGKKDGFVINKGATLYGNAHELHGHSINAPKDQKKKKPGSLGGELIRIGDGSSMHIQDLHIIGNEPADPKNIKLEDFEFSGDAVTFSQNVQADGKYQLSTMTNCIVENSQKLVHINGADVKIEGCIFRNGADANIASGTSAKKGSNITIKNSVSANSMVAGFLFYGFESVPENDTKGQQTLNIEGFFDIYNWKTTSTTKLVPATENLPFLAVADVVNNNVQKEVKKEKFAPFLYTEGDTQYIHVGIIRLHTGSCLTQDPTIKYNGKDELPPQYVPKSFPLPGWAEKLGIVKGVSMFAIKNQADLGDEKPLVMPGKDFTENVNIYEELHFGRTAK